MKVTVAMDSFKGSLSSMQAGRAAEQGIRRVFPDAEIFVRPIADGGEGTVDALIAGMGGVLETVEVRGPLGETVTAGYGILKQSRTAIMEMSAAAGITLLLPEKRNPMKTTTYGVGEMIADAIRNNCRNFIIGIGGSATNDGGAGMLQALGYRLLDKNGKDIPAGAEGLAHLCEIRGEGKLPELRECRFSIACDVTNPLCGENGCSAVYGPQKGADVQMVCTMDQAMKHYAEITRRYVPEADADYPGVGAAGGLGYAFRTFLQGELCSGVQLILRETALEQVIRQSDLVLTGEGRLDGQTAMGKAPVGVAAIAKRYGKPVIALAGCVASEAVSCLDRGIDAYFPIVRGAVSLDDAMNPENAASNMRNTAEQVFRLIQLYYKGEGLW